jgi:hypothetical protein
MGRVSGMSMTEPRAHLATIELNEPAPPEVPVGATFAVKVAVACHEGCDLHEHRLEIAAPAGAGEAQQAPGANVEADDALELTLRAPPRVGDHVWRISLPQHPASGVRHDAEPLSISVRVKPQSSSLAVWDIPSPVVMGDAFDIKAGAKSAGDVKLTGRTIEVCDETGAVLAQGCLGDAPWPGTSGLYWTQLRVPAPDREGPCAWSARFAATDVELPHDGATSNFSVAVTRPAEHRLTVKVSEKDTVNPVEGADVRVGVYRATTDPAGMAAIDVPKGTYELVVWKVGYDIPIQSIRIDTDRALEVEATIAPEEDPDAVWLM